MWSYAVQAERHVNIHLIGYWYGPTWPVQGMSRVCRQVHAETRLLAYAVNDFFSIDKAYFTTWLMARLPEQKAAIQRIAINCGNYPNLPLQPLPGLKSIVVECFCDEAVVDDCARGKAMINNLEDMLGNSGLKIQHLPLFLEK
jgi:hypothetical protein